VNKYILLIGSVIVILSLAYGCIAIKNVVFDKNRYPYLSEERYKEEIKGNQDVLAMLADKKDNSTIKRDVLHYIYFDSDEQKNNFITESNKIGYKIEPIEDENGIIIILNSTTDKETIDEQVLEICNLAVKYNGEYDGWETSICK